jgi:hypothetical protein
VREIDNIASKEECIAMAESFIKEAQLTRHYNVNYSCSERPAGT